MKPGAMFFRLFFITMVLTPVIKTQNYPYQNTYSNAIVQPSNNDPNYQISEVLNPTQIDPAALQETLNQLVFSKFLSNPSLKSIFEPNSKSLTKNEEIVKQGANDNVRSVVNNYFIVPPEFFNLNDTLVRKNGKSQPKIKRKKNQEAREKVIKEDNTKKSSRKKKSGKKIKSENLETISNPNEEVIIIHDEKEPKKRKRRKHQTIKSNNKKKTLSIKAKPEKLITNSEPIEENSAKKSKKIKRKKQKPIVELKSIDNLEISNSENIEIEKPKLKKLKRKPKINEVVYTNDKHLKNIEEPIDDTEKNNDITESRKIRDSKNRKETIDRNIAPIPEEVFKAFHPYFNQFYGKMPLNYKQFYNIPPYARNTENTNRRKSTKTDKPKPSTINVRYTPKTTPELKVTEKIDKKTDSEITNKTDDIQTTTEVAEVATEIPEETTTVKHDIITKENYKALHDEIEDLRPYLVPELRENIPYNNFINDYYPIFYDQNLYSNENDEQAIRHDESRYLYNTEVADFIRDRRKNDRSDKYKHKPFEKFTEIVDKEELRSKFKDSIINLEGNPKIIEKISNMEQKKTEVEPVFKTPPGLENPDFQTRNVKDYEETKAFNLKDAQSDKLSVYSSTKTDILPEIKRIRVPAKNTRPKTEEIETYYANSKVVKYGVPKDSIESNEYISTSTENEEKATEGHTTFIVAKSLGKVDDYYW